MNEINLKSLEALYLEADSIKEKLEIDRRYRLVLENNLDKNPQDIEALIQLGFLYWDSFHEQNKAIEYLEKAIRLDPKNIDAKYWLAKCLYHDFCDYEKSKKLIIETLSINPNRADCLALISAIIEDTTENYEEAVNYLKKAIQNEPTWPHLRFFLSSLYIEQKELNLAKKELNKGVELLRLSSKDPKNAMEEYYEVVVTGKKNQDGDSAVRLKKRILQAEGIYPSTSHLQRLFQKLRYFSDKQWQRKLWGEERVSSSSDDLDITIFDFFYEIDCVLLGKEKAVKVTEDQYKLLKEFREKLDHFKDKNKVYLNWIPSKELIELPEWEAIRKLAKVILEFFGE
jgi:tetratricopeptide (TPR) repeat protein